MQKKTIGTILGFLILAIAIEWYLLGTAQIFKVIALALGAFVGFYASEIAKKAVRARQAANQAWAYVVSFDILQQLEPNYDAHNQIIGDWNSAIINASSNRVEIDKQFCKKIFAIYDNQLSLTNTINWWKQNICISGKDDRFVSDIDRGLDELSNWNKYLSDDDIALLGPVILFEAISYRSSQVQMLTNAKAICTYIKLADPLDPIMIKLELQKFLFFYLRARVSLERLKTLVEASKAHGLFEHSKTLFGRL